MDEIWRRKKKVRKGSLEKNVNNDKKDIEKKNEKSNQIEVNKKNSKDKNSNKDHWITKSMMNKAYDVSPTLSKIKKHTPLANAF